MGFFKIVKGKKASKKYSEKLAKEARLKKAFGKKLSKEDKVRLKKIYEHTEYDKYGNPASVESPESVERVAGYSQGGKVEANNPYGWPVNDSRGRGYNK